MCRTNLMKGVISYNVPLNTARLLVIWHCSLQHRHEPPHVGTPWIASLLCLADLSTTGGRTCECNARWTVIIQIALNLGWRIPVEEQLVFYSLICQDISCALWWRGLTDMGRAVWVQGKCHPVHFRLGWVSLLIFVRSHYLLQLPHHFLHTEPHYRSCPRVTLCWL